MDWEKDVLFLERILFKFHMSLWTPLREELFELQADFGLRRFLGLDAAYRDNISLLLSELREGTLHWLEDEFSCRYVMLILPGETGRLLIAGPYLVESFSRERLRSEGEKLGLPPWLYRRVEDYYGSLPILADDSPLHNIFSAFAETLWGPDFGSIELRQKREEQGRYSFPAVHERETERILMDMQMLERRYAFENELM